MFKDWCNVEIRSCNGGLVCGSRGISDGRPVTACVKVVITVSRMYLCSGHWRQSGAVDVKEDVDVVSVYQRTAPASVPTKSKCTKTIALWGIQ
jgi:hypothetical protein